MPRGGKRKGAGRPKGSVEDRTLRKRAVKKAIDERVMKHADKLFHAQLAKAVGSVMVFRVDKKKAKNVHTQVTDPGEIKRFLDEHSGQSGIVGDSFYFVTDVAPDKIEIPLNVLDKASWALWALEAFTSAADAAAEAVEALASAAEISTVRIEATREFTETISADSTALATEAV